MGDARHPGIGGEGGEQRVQQVGATVDIADRADQMVGVERPGSVHPVASLDRHHAVTKPQKPTTRKGGTGLTRWGEGGRRWAEPAPGAWRGSRSEERRGGKECVSTGRSRWSPYHQTKNTTSCTQDQRSHAILNHHSKYIIETQM